MNRKTKSGRILTDADLDAIADEVETSDYDIEALKTRCRERSSIGSVSADVVPVRISPELKAAIEARAEANQTTASEIIREAVRKFLKVA